MNPLASSTQDLARASAAENASGNAAGNAAESVVENAEALGAVAGETINETVDEAIDEETGETEANAFAALGLAPQLVQAVADMGYIAPTPVQQQAIPLALPQAVQRRLH